MLKSSPDNCAFTSTMPRRASHLNSSLANTPKKLSTPTSLNRTPSSRQSTRLKSSPLAATATSAKPKAAETTNGSTTRTTPKKSQYFSVPSESPSEASSFENEESGYEDEDASASAISSPPASSDEASSPEPSSEDERPAKKRKRGVGQEKANKKVLVKTNGEGAVVGEKGQELWRPGVKSKLAPGEAVFVALPKARGDGGLRYEDGRVHPNTMVFLKELKENNDREWLKGGCNSSIDLSHRSEVMREVSMGKAKGRGKQVPAKISLLGEDVY